jgi:hypothetical protein
LAIERGVGGVLWSVYDLLFAGFVHSAANLKHLLTQGAGVNKSRVMQEALHGIERTAVDGIARPYGPLPTHLTASMTSMSFELLRSDDKVTREAARRMIDRMVTISAGLDEHWRLIGELTGVQAAHEPIETSSSFSRRCRLAAIELIGSGHRLA